jgi:hypothetical protein
MQSKTTLRRYIGPGNPLLNSRHPGFTMGGIGDTMN